MSTSLSTSPTSRTRHPASAPAPLLPSASPLASIRASWTSFYSTRARSSRPAAVTRRFARITGGPSSLRRRPHAEGVDRLDVPGGDQRPGV